jgi:hypothetical protein
LSKGNKILHLCVYLYDFFVKVRIPDMRRDYIRNHK